MSGYNHSEWVGMLRFRHYNLGNPNTIVKNKKTLQNKDIIEKEKENFAFVDPIYRLWFKQEYC